MRPARDGDVEGLAALHARVAAELTAKHGRGHWTNCPTEKAVARALRDSHVWVATRGGLVIATYRLSKRKPWAIDTSYFTVAKRPLYLHDMAVIPARQRRGVGRKLLAHVEAAARGLEADAIRLDAYDAPAGAGGFYARCGCHEVGRKVYRGNPLVYFERLLRERRSADGCETVQLCPSS